MSKLEPFEIEELRKRGKLRRVLPTTAKSLQCIPCNGKGWAWDQSEQIDCPDCTGTGLAP